MKRYNQGFMKFGPMEQCKDGEWVEYKDYHNELIGWINRVSSLKDTNLEQYDCIKLLSNKIIGWSMACLVLSLALIACLVRILL